MLLKSWQLIFLTSLLSEFSQSTLINSCPECTDVCSDAANISECTEGVKQCMDPEVSPGRMCYIDGANLSPESLMYLALKSSFYSEKVKVIYKTTVPPNNVIFMNVRQNMQLRITTLILSALCKNYAPIEENCRQNATYDQESMSSLPPRHKNKMIVRNLKISFSCIRNYKKYGKLSIFFRDIRRLDFTANFFEEIPTSAFGELDIKEFIISCNRIKTLTKDSFKNLSNVTYLDLAMNYITEIAENAFEDTPNLEVIILSRNYIITVYSELFRSNQKLRVIDLKENELCNLTGFVENLYELEVISFENNHISELPEGFFSSNSKLKDVNFQGNKFQQLPYFMLNQGNLTLAHNLIKKIGSLKNVKNASKLDLSHNCLQISDNENKTMTSDEMVQNLVCWHCCLGKHFASIVVQSIVQTADLRYNHIQKIDNEFLKDVSHLKTVLLGNEQKLYWNLTFVYPVIQDQTNGKNPNPTTLIKMFDFSIMDCDFISILRHIGNISLPPKPKLRSDIKFELHNVTVGRQRFKDTVSVRNDVIERYRDLVCGFPYYCPEQCDCYTKGLDPAVIVNCIGKNLNRFPYTNDFSYPVKLYLGKNKITHLPNTNEIDWTIIQELHLEYNAIETLNGMALHPGFNVLQFNNNKLQNFSPLIKSTLTSRSWLSIVSLSGNPWKCECNATEVKNLMIASENVVDYENITCTSVMSGKVLFLKNVTSSDVCIQVDSNDLQSIQMILVFITLIIINILFIAVLYRYRAEIKVWFLYHGYCMRFVAIKEEIETDKTFDVFISYSTLDEEWVGTHLVPGLENGDPSYTVCVHGRNWPAGEFITNMVYESLKQSRRTIIVLTDNYVRSEWCRFEFQVAYSQCISDGLSRILAVVPKNLPSRGEISGELQAFITLQTYLKWDDPNFWEKLRCSMPRVKAREHERSDKDVDMLLMNSRVNV